MILYGLRTVATCVYNSPSSSELKPFVRSKALSQAKNFNAGNIPGLFQDLYELDKKIKIGELNPDLAVTIAIEKILIA
jgi:DNA polymerase III delta subunit